MAILYRYVGPVALLEQLVSPVYRALVETAASVRKFQDFDGRSQNLIATFVIDTEGRLWIADRHSEHVSCARGGAVRSAGEIELQRSGTSVIVIGVTNQSTGYCPEPSSWPEVASALDAAGLAHPGAFTIEITFRRCASCSQINLVKDGYFFCDTCDQPLTGEGGFARIAE